MGFFSKVWKGVKKTFKKIGRGIKKAFKSVGKFMGKIGILGTIALTILTGGIAGGLGGMFTKFGTTLGKLGTSMGGVTGSILKGASWTIGKAAQFGSAIKNGFSTLTKGVTEFFGQTGKWLANKIPGVNIEGASTDFLGKDGVWARTSEAVAKEFETFQGSVGDLFTKTSPTLEAGKAKYLETMQSTTGLDKNLLEPTDGYEFRELTDEDIYRSGTADLNADPTNMPTIPKEAPVPEAAAVEAPKRSLLDKYTDPQTYIDGAAKMARETPGAVVTSVGTQLAMNAIMGTPDYATAPSFGSYAPQFASQDYGAVQQGLTPMATDGYQDMVFAYDALGQQSGAYGNLYKQRLGAFA
jgi:hypothetical protein